MKLAVVWLVSWLLSGLFVMVAHNLNTDHDCQVVSSRVPLPVRPAPEEVVVVYAPYQKGKIDMMTDPSEAWVDCGSACID